MEGLNWSQILKESPLDWLLEESNPSVRYSTLRGILDKDRGDPHLIAAKNAIAKSQVIRRILAKQHSEGYWEEPDNPYHPKYKSSYWQIMTLGQLGMDKTDERLEDAVKVLLQKRQSDGTWMLESTPAGRMQANIEAKGKPSKWITMIALRVLKRLSAKRAMM